MPLTDGQRCELICISRALPTLRAVPTIENIRNCPGVNREIFDSMWATSANRSEIEHLIKNWISCGMSFEFFKSGLLGIVGHPVYISDAMHARIHSEALRIISHADQTTLQRLSNMKMDADFVADLFGGTAGEMPFLRMFLLRGVAFEAAVHHAIQERLHPSQESIAGSPEAHTANVRPVSVRGSATTLRSSATTALNATPLPTVAPGTAHAYSVSPAAHPPAEKDAQSLHGAGAMAPTNQIHWKQISHKDFLAIVLDAISNCNGFGLDAELYLMGISRAKLSLFTHQFPEMAAQIEHARAEKARTMPFEKFQVHFAHLTHSSEELKMAAYGRIYEKIASELPSLHFVPTDNALKEHFHFSALTIRSAREYFPELNAQIRTHILSLPPRALFAVDQIQQNSHVKSAMDERIGLLILGAIKNAKKPPSDLEIARMLGAGDATIRGIKTRLARSNPKLLARMGTETEKWINRLPHEEFCSLLQKMPSASDELRSAIDKRITREVLTNAVEALEEGKHPTISLAALSNISGFSVDVLTGFFKRNPVTRTVVCLLKPLSEGNTDEALAGILRTTKPEIVKARTLLGLLRGNETPSKTSTPLLSTEPAQRFLALSPPLGLHYRAQEKGIAGTSFHPPKKRIPHSPTQRTPSTRPNAAVKPAHAHHSSAALPAVTRPNEAVKPNAAASSKTVPEAASSNVQPNPSARPALPTSPPPILHAPPVEPSQPTRNPVRQIPPSAVSSASCAPPHAGYSPLELSLLSDYLKGRVLDFSGKLIPQTPSRTKNKSPTENVPAEIIEELAHDGIPLGALMPAGEGDLFLGLTGNGSNPFSNMAVLTDPHSNFDTIFVDLRTLPDTCALIGAINNLPDSKKLVILESSEAICSSSAISKLEHANFTYSRLTCSRKETCLSLAVFTKKSNALPLSTLPSLSAIRGAMPAPKISPPPSKPPLRSTTLPSPASLRTA